MSVETFLNGRVTMMRGDVLAMLKTLPDGHFDCVVTSPPYWGLRDYGIEPSIWGGRPDCSHEWGDTVRAANANSVAGPTEEGDTWLRSTEAELSS